MLVSNAFNIKLYLNDDKNISTEISRSLIVYSYKRWRILLKQYKIKHENMYMVEVMCERNLDSF